MRKEIGTALPLTALPRQLDDSKEFLLWLKKTGQSLWQMLPLHDTPFEHGSRSKHVPSPYKGYGVGLNPQLIPKFWKNKKPTQTEMLKFTAKYNEWIFDYALFVSLRDYFGTDEWNKWPVDIRDRKQAALKFWKEKLKNPINAAITDQWRAHKAFGQIITIARSLSIKLIADIPFYLPLASPLVWMHQNLFVLNRMKRMECVSGVVGGRKSYFGRQIWGHPLYDWKKKKNWKEIVQLWSVRLKYCSQLYNMARLDHANGLYVYGSLSLKSHTADRLLRGPGRAVLKEIVKKSRDFGLFMYAEDLSSRARKLRRDLRSLKVPGIRIFRFAYRDKQKIFDEKYMRIKSYPKHSFAYTTTHDTETLMGYLRLLSLNEKQGLARRAKVVFNNNDKILAKEFRTAVIKSPSNRVIVSMQDWLLTFDRINVPGTERAKNDRNWKYVLKVPISRLPNLNGIM